MKPFTYNASGTVSNSQEFYQARNDNIIGSCNVIAKCLKTTFFALTDGCNTIVQVNGSLVTLLFNPNDIVNLSYKSNDDLPYFQERFRQYNYVYNQLETYFEILEVKNPLSISVNIEYQETNLLKSNTYNNLITANPTIQYMTQKELEEKIG
jgi:hypothetical protein